MDDRDLRAHLAEPLLLMLTHEADNAQLTVKQVLNERLALAYGYEGDLTLPPMPSDRAQSAKSASRPSAKSAPSQARAAKAGRARRGKRR